MTSAAWQNTAKTNATGLFDAKADGGRHAKPSALLYIDMQVQSAILKRVALVTSVSKVKVAFGSAAGMLTTLELSFV